TRLTPAVGPSRGGSQEMRRFAHCAAVGALVFGLSGVETAQAQPKDAASVVAAARKAVGGEKKLAAVKSFTAQGRTRQVRGENLVPIEFEIFVELPDKYLRKDEIPAQESGPTASGFNGEEGRQDPPPAAPPPPPAAPAGAAPAGAPWAPGAPRGPRGRPPRRGGPRPAPLARLVLPAPPVAPPPGHARIQAPRASLRSSRT